MPRSSVSDATCVIVTSGGEFWAVAERIAAEPSPESASESAPAAVRSVTEAR